MKIGLWNNWLWYEWAEILAKGRKGKLQPWMIIDLSHNYIWDEWLKALTEEWKWLPSWFVINLEGNGISDKWVQYIMDNWELNGWVKISLFGDISPKMEEELENWVQREYKDKWINCEVLV